jgi:poly-gamma-glutamate synthesis protein (capsule biosynthesis protein)
MRNLKIYNTILALTLTLSLTTCTPITSAAEAKTFIPKENVQAVISVKNNDIVKIMPKKIMEDVQVEVKKLPTEITLSFTGDCTLGTYVGQNPRFDIISSENEDTYNFENVASIFKDDDLTIVNLEGPLTDEKIYQDKQFPIKGKEEYALALTNVEICNLKNNHTYDYGISGYNDTINALNENNIAYFDENNFYITEVKGKKIGFAGFSSNYDVKNGIDKALNYFKENNTDLEIINLHGGIEYDYDFDSLKQSLAKYAIDNGADLVVGHHPHILQGIEEYKGKYIIYSLGNFCFGANNNPRDYRSAIAQVKFTYEDDNLKTSLNLIPLHISSVDSINDFKPTPVYGEEAEEIINLINEHSENFTYHK